MKGGNFYIVFAILQVISGLSAAEKYSFLVAGDPQYLAEKSKSPKQLDPYSEKANNRAITLLKSFSGRSIPEDHGGGKVSEKILGLINTGDLIDSADKTGGNYPAMQEFEWKRYKTDYGLTGKDGLIPFPVYEVHGNHDGPQGDTFIVKNIIERNRKRPGIVNRSDNGLHYSWNWGPLHCINLGIFVGKGDKRRNDHHYAPRSSLKFLHEDLADEVGKSGRPVIISFHLHPNCPEYDWP
ncbi:metallophosphoesterase, partial [bacterium]|nr:metallophosphoesterase [bacterium]